MDFIGNNQAAGHDLVLEPAAFQRELAVRAAGHEFLTRPHQLRFRVIDTLTRSDIEIRLPRVIKELKPNAIAEQQLIGDIRHTVAAQKHRAFSGLFVHERVLIAQRVQLRPRQRRRQHERHNQQQTRTIEAASHAAPIHKARTKI